MVFELLSTIPDHRFTLLGGVCLGLFFLLSLLRPTSDTKGLPLINSDDMLDPFSYKRKMRFLQSSNELLKDGFSKSPSGFRIMTHNGQMTVLSSIFANELRNDDRLNAREAIQEEFLAHMPSFAPITGGSMTDEAVSKSMLRITRALGALTEPMSEEVDLCLQTYWTDNPDWHEVHLAEGLLRMVVQVSARAFLGKGLGRDPRWIEATLGYMAKGFTSVFTLHLFPKCLHSLLQWVLPMCREARAHLSQARVLMQPELDRRETMDQKPNDAITWMEESARGSPFDPVAGQLSLSFAATHTTSDFLTKLFVHLCENPEIVPELRKEIISAIGENGMTKEGMSHLRLLDSVMKESQRMNPLALATMTRRVLKSVTLKNGLELPQGSNLIVSTKSMNDPDVYAEPHRFKGHRFLSMREGSGKENRHQFVSTGEHHLGFGHGVHACPGRFFAAHELKIFLSHILLKYDFKFPDGYQPRFVTAGFFVPSDPNCRMLIRRRKEEITMTPG